jgi:hypothetical protein
VPKLLGYSGRISYKKKNKIKKGEKEMEKIKCSECNGEMTPDILFTHFPEGKLPVRGYRCEKCGYELIPLDEAKRVQNEAEKLGLYGVANPLTGRRITKSGNNLSVYIPREYQKELNLKPKTPIRMWLQGDRICIEPETT